MPIPFLSLKEQTALVKAEVLRELELPRTETAASTEISLPMFPELSDSAADEVIAAVRDVCRELA